MLQTSGSRRCVYQTAPLSATFRAVFFACMDCLGFCHTGIQTLYFYSQGSSMIMLPAGTQTEWQIEQTLWRHKEKKRKQLPADTSQMCCSQLFILSLLCFTKQFKFNRFIIYRKTLLCEPMNFFSSGEEVRQLFGFHKQSQMCLWFQANGIQTVGGNWSLWVPRCC